VVDIDYKNMTLLRNFITERGKLISGRSTGNCAKHHRMLTRAIKRARNIALLPYLVV
jgi:small subunit ribosomal protein S18